MQNMYVHIYILKKLISSYAQFETRLSFACIIEGFINHKEKKKRDTSQHSYTFFCYHIHFNHTISKDVKWRS